MLSEHGLQFPVKLCGEPSQHQLCGDLVTRCIMDHDLLNLIQMGEAFLLIEQLRKRETAAEKARPCQVAKNDALPGVLLDFEKAGELLARIFPFVAVVDEAVDPGPEISV